MAKIVQLTPKVYSDVAYVVGVANHDQTIIRELERHLRRYFDDHYRGVFFCGYDSRLEIFQDAFVVLWEKIERGSIYVEDGVIYGRNGKTFSSALTTYFMSIAKLKNLEMSRNKEIYRDIEEEEIHHKKLGDGFEKELIDYLYDDETHLMEEVIAECISVMSGQCNQILTKFYYEGKSLDVILDEIPTITNKNALKTRKYKCMEILRRNAQAIYKRVVNS